MKANNKEIHGLPISLLRWRHIRILLTKGQQWGKRLHLMTSSSIREVFFKLILVEGSGISFEIASEFLHERPVTRNFHDFFSVSLNKLLQNSRSGGALTTCVGKLHQHFYKIMACRLFDTKPLSEPMLTYYQFDHKEQTSMKFESKYKIFHSWKYAFENVVCERVAILSGVGGGGNRVKWTYLAPKVLNVC